ncbi:MAG: gamma-glutamyltransferase, partial [Gemmatimonadetes bacterium]|nr:gamma-glutamyltransferase [Gemmatimonadota bacterium]
MRRLALAAVLLTALATRAGAQTPRGATDAGAARVLQKNRDYAPPRDRVPAHFPAGWRFAAGGAPFVARRAVVVSDAPIASRVGSEIMRRGGNAVDAAVATEFALAVVYPEAGNIGGGGFMVIHLADGRNAAIDFREVAPLAATRDMYVGPDGKVTDQSLIGPIASGVPGSVAGLTAVQARYGTMPLSAVMRPAIRLAERGFVVDSAMAGKFASYAHNIAEFGGATLFVPGGQSLRAGETLKQPALAKTLRAIARQGSKAFYTGPIAEAWTSELAKQGGIITMEDLRRYRPVWRTPIRSTYRGNTLLTMPPASSGGVTMT